MGAAALLQSLRRSAMERLDRGRRAVSDFKGRHFAGEIVLWAVRSPRITEFPRLHTP